MNLNLRPTDYEDMVLQDGVWIPSGEYFNPVEMFKKPSRWEERLYAYVSGRKVKIDTDNKDIIDEIRKYRWKH